MHQPLLVRHADPPGIELRFVKIQPFLPCSQSQTQLPGAPLLIIHKNWFNTPQNPVCIRQPQSVAHGSSRLAEQRIRPFQIRARVQWVLRSGQHYVPLACDLSCEVFI